MKVKKQRRLGQGWGSEVGAGLVEYALLIALIAIISLAAIEGVGIVFGYSFINSANTVTQATFEDGGDIITLG